MFFIICLGHSIIVRVNSIMHQKYVFQTLMLVARRNVDGVAVRLYVSPHDKYVRMFFDSIAVAYPKQIFGIPTLFDISPNRSR